MEKKETEIMHMGGGFGIQPEHKKSILPLDFLAAFYNVDADNPAEVLEFANNYNFGWYLMPDQKNSISDKFVKIQNRYHKILKNLIYNEAINHTDLDTINDDLEATAPKISLRNTVNDLDNIANSFCLFILTSVGDEKPVCTVDRKGSLELDTVEKSSYINIKMSAPENSKAKWYINRTGDGIKRAPELIPSDKWDLYKEDLRYATLYDLRIENNHGGNPIYVEMNLKIGKVNFTREELTAVWSPTTGESFIAKRIWDYINSDYVGYKFKMCKNCGKVHLGTSKYFCDNPKCKTDWDAKRKKIEYDLKKK